MCKLASRLGCRPHKLVRFPLYRLNFADWPKQSHLRSTFCPGACILASVEEHRPCPVYSPDVVWSAVNLTQAVVARPSQCSVTFFNYYYVKIVLNKQKMEVDTERLQKSDNG